MEIHHGGTERTEYFYFFLRGLRVSVVSTGYTRT
jgi:hypothetical protein